MANPVLIAKAVLAAASDKRTWKAIGCVLLAAFSPLILGTLIVMGALSGAAAHNNDAIQLCFHGGEISQQVPADYAEHIRQMRACFAALDTAIAEINEQTEGESLDGIRVKAVFYSLYFGDENLSMESSDYRKFADCFVKYEKRTRTVTDPDGDKHEESYTVAVPLKSMPDVYANLQKLLGRTATDSEQANASEIYYRISYGTGAPTEGDGFSEWEGWMPGPGDVSPANDLPEGALGSEIVRLALTRLGDPYSEGLRGTGSYVDCSYLTMWSYAQTGISIPGTAAAQAKFCVEKGLTVSRQNLAPGDLIFWSYEPNGRYLNITHVGIYAGDGKVIDASSTKLKVVYRKIYDADKQVMYGRPSLLKPS
ncbi:hydrolase Nlp/P60 [Clostridium sp. W14A]|nr:hydrolase Nlp/P60 [Clostridium sp. W14A]